MFDFEKFLKNLVLENRRVIIPELGAFLLKEDGGAQRSYIFSSFLKYNDGFLENSLKAQSGMTAEEANQKVRNFVDTITQTLSTTPKYYVKDMGHFIVDGRGSVHFVFEQENEGLVSAQAYMPTPAPIALTSSKHKLDKKSNRWKVFIAVPLLLLLVGFLYIFVGSKMQDNSIGNSSTEQISLQVVPAKEVLESTLNTQSQTPPSTEINSTVSQGPVYHVVGGCFSDKINADRFMEACIENGYKNAEILPKMGDLTPVSVMQFSSKHEAERKKNEYNEKYDDEAWVYRTY